MKKLLQILNCVAFVSVVFINYLSNTGAMNNTTIGEISSDYKSLFTPASYAFSIWGLIYLLLFGFVIYQGRSFFVKVKDNSFVEKIGFWFIISCVANSTWVFCWIYEYTGLSCICIFLLLFSLLKIVQNAELGIGETRFSQKLFLWWPFAIYSGWVTVASIANVSTYLIKIDWNGLGLTPLVWTITLIIIATIVNIVVIWRRNMNEFAMVGAWALIAIGVANADKANYIQAIAYAAAAILFLAIAFRMFKKKPTTT